MRRRLGRFLPIVMLALMVQIFAPIAACWAATIAASDPLAAALICSGSGGKSGQAGQTDQNGGHHRGDCCSVCCVAQTAAPLDQPDPAAFSIPERQADRVIWLALRQQAITEPAKTHAQARAPPAFS